MSFYSHNYVDVKRNEKKIRKQMELIGCMKNWKGVTKKRFTWARARFKTAWMVEAHDRVNSEPFGVTSEGDEKMLESLFEGMSDVGPEAVWAVQTQA